MGRPRKLISDLPPNVYFKNGAYYHVKAGVWTRLGKERKDIQGALKAININSTVPVADIAKNLHEQARKRAATNKLEFILTVEDVTELFERANRKCELTGIPFSNARPDGLRVRPWAASLDRIDSSVGYTMHNVRLICTAMNIALNEFGEDYFARMALSYVKFRPQLGKK